MPHTPVNGLGLTVEFNLSVENHGKPLRKMEVPYEASCDLKVSGPKQKMSSSFSSRITPMTQLGLRDLDARIQTKENAI